MGDEEVPRERRETESEGEELDEVPAPDTYYAQAKWKRALIIFAGPAVNLIFAMLVFSGINAVQGVPTQIEPEVSAVQSGTTAAEVGLESGDRITALDGQSVQSWGGFEEIVDSRSPGEEISITYLRDGEQRTVSGELGAITEASNQALVGVRPTVTEVSHSPFLALWEGAQQTVGLIGTYISGLYQLATGQIAFFENVSGPVGITTIGSQAISAGIYASLGMLAIISMILGVMNLLPILPLDGGHLLFIAAEALRRKPITEETMNKVALVGLMLFLTLFLFATYADISKIITGQPFIPR